MLNLLTDLAFNLLIFFVVCASTEPEKGLPQKVPSASKDKAPTKQTQNIEVALTRTTISVNQATVQESQLTAKMKDLLKGKTQAEDRIVILKSEKDTPYRVWIRVTAIIEEAGGVVTLQLEEENEVRVR